VPVYKRGGVWWADFRVHGKRYREPTGKRNKNAAKTEERNLIQAAEQGHLRAKQEQPKSLFAAVDAYLADKKIRCMPRTVELETERLSIVKQYFGDIRLTVITPDGIAQFQGDRQNGKVRTKDRAGRKVKAANRTVNMDVGALLRVLDFCGHLRRLKDRLKRIHPLPEPEAMVGRALTVEEQDRLFEAAQSNSEWEHVYCAAVVAAHTSLCSVEVRRLRRRDVDLFNKKLSVPYGKNKHRLRVIPLLAPAIKALGRMIERLDTLGLTSPDHYLWCACKWNQLDATKPQSRWDSAWHALRDNAGLPGLRFHDLRHTIITELLESGAPDFVVEAITGQVSRKMLKHYGHIRQTEMLKALQGVEERREQKRRELRERSGDTTADSERVQ
jgi:integrase